MQDSDNDHSIGVGDAAIDHVEIGRWDNAYGPGPGFDVRNSFDPDHFVEQDPSRFYLRIRDPAANVFSTLVEQITARLGTRDAGGAVDDDMTDIVLVENAPGSGEFVSRSQMLTSHDIQVADDPNADDEFGAHDGLTGAVVDDAIGDRTHRAEIDGEVQLDYQPAGAPAGKTWRLPVCRRSPEDRRKVQLRVHVYNEPFADVGLDGAPGTGDAGEGDGVFSFTDANGNGAHDAGEASEPYVDLSHGGAMAQSGSAAGVADGRGPVVTNNQVRQQLERADIAWAQVCIKTEQLGPILIEDAPRVMGIDILLDGAVSPADWGAIYTAHNAVIATDTVDVFFAAPIAGANAIAFPPANPAIAHGEDSFVILAPNLAIDLRTLAHELGHVFLNQPDSANTQVEFFPAQSTFRDNAVNSYRRVTQATATDARTVRPAGAITATGNTVLKLP